MDNKKEELKSIINQIISCGTGEVTEWAEYDELVTEFADRIVKLLDLHSVSNRRELLIAYGEWIHELAGCSDIEKATTLADTYLSNL